MKKRNYYFITAGVICLFTALLHTIAGQADLIDPMLATGLDVQKKTELLGVWHMATIFIFIAAIILLKNGFRPQEIRNTSIDLLAWLFIGFSVVFISVSIFQQTLAPQWILCLPIGVLALIGSKKKLMLIE